MGTKAKRAIGLYNGKNELLLVVIADIYHPDCFKWDKLLKRGWSAHTRSIIEDLNIYLKDNK